MMCTHEEHSPMPSYYCNLKRFPAADAFREQTEARKIGKVSLSKGAAPLDAPAAAIEAERRAGQAAMLGSGAAATEGAMPREVSLTSLVKGDSADAGSFPSSEMPITTPAPMADSQASTRGSEAPDEVPEADELDFKPTSEGPPTERILGITENALHAPHAALVEGEDEAAAASAVSGGGLGGFDAFQAAEFATCLAVGVMMAVGQQLIDGGVLLYNTFSQQVLPRAGALARPSVVSGRLQL